MTAPANWQVVSNGATISAETDGEKTVHTFATTAKMSTYLVALVAGPYAAGFRVKASLSTTEFPANDMHASDGAR